MSCQELSNIYIESISWNVWSKTCQLIFKRIDCVIGKGSPLKKKGDTNTTEFIVLINYHIHHTKFKLKKYSTLTTSISQDTVDAWNKQIRLMTANTYSPVTCCGMGQSTGIILWKKTQKCWNCQIITLHQPQNITGSLLSVPPSLIRFSLGHLTLAQLPWSILF